MDREQVLNVLEGPRFTPENWPDLLEWIAATNGWIPVQRVRAQFLSQWTWDDAPMDIYELVVDNQRKTVLAVDQNGSSWAVHEEDKHKNPTEYVRAAIWAAWRDNESME